MGQRAALDNIHRDAQGVNDGEQQKDHQPPQQTDLPERKAAAPIIAALFLFLCQENHHNTDQGRSHTAEYEQAHVQMKVATKNLIRLRVPLFIGKSPLLDISGSSFGL
jgi:hypothetical protein